MVESASLERILIELGRVQGMLEGLVHEQRGTTRDVQALEVRTRKLEQGRAWLLGAGAVCGTVASLIATHFLK